MGTPYKKFLLFLFIVPFLFITNRVRADEIIVTKNGEVVNVTEKGKSVLGASSTIHATVSVTPPTDNGNKIMVGISDVVTGKSLNKVTDLLTLEQAEGQPIIINASGSAQLLLIKQGFIRVTTGFRVFIDSATQTLHVEALGKKIKIMSPLQMVRKVIEDKIMNPTLSKIRLELVNNRVSYNIEGSEKLNVFGLIKITLPIKVMVAADVGTIINVQRHLISNALWSVNSFVERIFRVSVVQADLH